MNFVQGNMSPLVSIVIPTYNYGHYLPEAIDSALSQTYPRIEVIVIDDGSTDNSAIIAASYGPSIHYVWQENQGLPAARNSGLQMANGDIIQFLDADDSLPPESIAHRVSRLWAPSAPDWVCCRSRFFYAKGSGLKTRWLNLRHGWPLPRQEKVVTAFCYRNIAPPHAFMIKTSAIRKHGLEFDTRLRACEDYDFWLRLMCLSGPPLVVPETVVLYRVHSGSMSKDASNQVDHDIIMVDKTLRAIIEHKLPVEPDSFEALGACFASLCKAACLLSADRLEAKKDALESLYYRILDELEKTEPSTSAFPQIHLQHLNRYAARLRKQDFLLEERGIKQVHRLLSGCGSFILHWISVTPLTRMTAQEAIRYILFDFENLVYRRRRERLLPRTDSTRI